MTTQWNSVGPGRAVSVDGRRILLALRNPARLYDIIPSSHCLSLVHNGMTFVAVPLRKETVLLLRNAGYDTTALEPIRYQYDAPLIEGQFPPMPHQITTAAFFTTNPRAFCTSTMRTGKTASSIIAMDYLLRRGEVDAWLIVCTVSTMNGVWRKEIEGMCPGAVVEVLHGSKAKRLEALARPAQFYIVNYDGIKILREELNTAVATGRIGGCVIDELTHYCNAQTARWGAIDEVVNGTRWAHSSTSDGKKVRRRTAPARGCSYVWGLTGTPGGPEGIYGQVKLVRPEFMQMSFTAWREMVMMKINQFKWIPHPQHKAVIQRHLQPCIRFDKKDIMDLPPVIHQTRECELSKEQDRTYKHLRREMILELADGNEVRAVNKAALVSKLLQVAGGVVKGSEGTAALDMSPRMNVLREVIAESQTKVVIFAAFTAVLDRLHDELCKDYRVGLVDGRVTGHVRDEVFADFQRNDRYDVLLCHPKTTAFGVELSAADTIVFFGPPLSGEFVYQQAVERLSSLSQKADQIGIVHLVATAEERKLFKSIRDGVDINEAINDIFNTIKKD